jgi:hypothetical protein
MKVKIKNYIDWFGPYHLSEAICFWAPKTKDEFGYDQFPEWVEKFGDWISNTWISDFLGWIYDKRRRTVTVKVDKWDIWSADHTLALVILPVLIEYRKSKRYGVPIGIDTSYIPLEEAEEDKQMQAWNEIVDKMIWSFEQIVNFEEADQEFWIDKPDFDDCKKWSDFADKINNGRGRLDTNAWKEYQEKIQEGLDLFGKHFRNLWD